MLDKEPEPVLAVAEALHDTDRVNYERSLGEDETPEKWPGFGELIDAQRAEKIAAAYAAIKTLCNEQYWPMDRLPANASPRDVLRAFFVELLKPQARRNSERFRSVRRHKESPAIR